MKNMIMEHEWSTTTQVILPVLEDRQKVKFHDRLKVEQLLNRPDRKKNVYVTRKLHLNASQVL